MRHVSVVFAYETGSSARARASRAGYRGQAPAYRQATAAGCSTGWPAWMDQASRMNCAVAQPSGVADRVAVPVAKPGWPAGGRVSQACSDRKKLGVAAPAIV